MPMRREKAFDTRDPATRIEWHKTLIAQGDTSPQRLALLRKAEKQLKEKAMTEKQWPLTAFKSFRVDGKVIARGTVVTDEQLASWFNGAALVAAGIVRRTPPSAARPAAPRPAPPPAPSTPIIDVVEQVRSVLRGYVDANGGNWRAAEDKLLATNPTLYTRAQAEYSRTVGKVGVGRRITDNFLAFLQAPPAPPASPPA
jgi:hypothetical protein